jgi:hypothetical protein
MGTSLYELKVHYDPSQNSNQRHCLDDTHSCLSGALGGANEVASDWLLGLGRLLGRSLLILVGQ